ncbi:MAG: hypothetical protein UX80_C0024G0024 [Candidatus Amesbacteria bacterium GW2011_GWA2_47_11b]|uniref:Uncharacterized protein n=3 Tax=Candidatus Amesiibacteriota TaxID=1752730 RepID=A0A0G1SJQ8_9BACT|nr:MAG: hypothetical protein UX42_C0008G0034 [Microgenomates group bacterium GW2011_GWC1_46_20]KKU57158.1 MAG: hypothetical protein UX80_C0024G0024 [Candidatus Amesbacteria bacterium GW2011_GWA2_47_11b]KKU69714.1 MAG: hypothetical protein UX92_C0012G0057 [Candidatus Amesbacteria bacterium GW2011_GWA1_47_20]KKU82917.1 MAG: hypothetical protein UY11_C0035G0008 [Candidatus Amesbacteria bacterium GW2011_GWC2_47_8]
MGQIGLIGQIVLMIGIAGWTRSWWLAVGWIIGYALAEADHLFYVAVCNPQELTCQRVRQELGARSWKSAWELLRRTAGERTRLPIHNVLTGLIVAVLGWWVVNSVGSMLAAGVVVGLGVRLFTEFLAGNKKSWFWVFAREFSVGEVWVVGGVWGVLQLISVVGLVR